MKRNISTPYRDLVVHSTGYRKASNGTYTLYGYAANINGIRISGSTTLRRIAKTEADIPLTEKHLVAAVLSALPKRNSSKSQKISGEPEEGNPMTKTFRALKAENCAAVFDSWSDRVLRRNLSIFEGRVLPRIQNMDAFTVADRDALLSELIADIKKNGHCKQNESVVLSTAKSTLAAAARIYQEMRRRCADLPDLDLAPPRLGRSIYPEQFKSLPQAVRDEFASTLQQAIAKEPLMVICAVLMWDAGLRTAEAAAVDPKENIIPIGNGRVSVQVLWQEKNGERSAVLKRSSSYRIVPLSYWGQYMIEACLSAMDPSVTSETPVSADRVSAWVRSLLLSCIRDPKFFETVRYACSREANVDDAELRDLTAYVLRRDRASRWRNICGLSSSECDYLLGHVDKHAKKRRIDYTLPEEQRRISAQLENYIYDRNISRHPAIAPIDISHGLDCKIGAYGEIRYRNTSSVPVVVRLHCSTNECGESIQVSASENVTCSLSTYRRKTAGIRKNRPIIGRYRSKGGDFHD